MAYNWPGNIRELENMMERTMLFCEGPEIHARDLPPEMAHLVDTTLAGAAARARRCRLPMSTGRGRQRRGGRQLVRPTTLTSMPAATGGSLKEAVRAETERVERELIVRALDETSGNVTQAARKLKISRKSLQTKMKEFGLRDREGARD